MRAAALEAICSLPSHGFSRREVWGDHSTVAGPPLRPKPLIQFSCLPYPRRSALTETFDVFLSHNRKDKERVRAIADALEAKDVKVWLDERELTPGRRWIPELERQIRAAPAIAVFIGENGIGPWEEPEIEAALRESVRRNVPVLPVPLPGAPEDLKLPLFLESYTWVDLRRGITPEGIDRLVWGITGEKPLPGAGPLPAGPRRHNLPFRSLGDLLKGRDNDLRTLAASLEGPSHATLITQPQVVHGLGGIGKTRLAVEYAWRSGDRYAAAFFVVAGSRESLRVGLAKLAMLLLPDLPVGRAEDEVVEAVLICLQDQSRWLLILDNVDSEEAKRAVLEILPRLNNGHVLVTARRSHWPEGIEERSLDRLHPEEAARFLLERTGKRRTPAADDEARASELATILDGLPLALEQAAAYISHRRISLFDYLEDWEREREAVLSWFNPTVMQYPASVAATWQKTADELGPTARALLRLCAFLAPDPIPVEMFEEGKELVDEVVSLLCEETGEEPRTQVVVEALGDLAEYSMISHEGRTFRVHRMVQEVIRSRVPGDRERSWIEQGLYLVRQYPPADPYDVRTWPIWESLRPHAVQLLIHSDRSGIVKPITDVMSGLAGLLYGKALHTEAEPLLRRALAIDEDSFGNEHPNVARDLNNLAALLQDTNRLDEAEPLMRRALKIDEDSFGNEHPNVARGLNNLAQLLQATNRRDEAEPLMRRALKIDEDSFGNEHPNVARDLNNLAALLQDTNRRDEAEPLMRRALKIDEDSFGNEHPKVAIRLNNLARLLQATNRLDEAEPLMRRAVEILERSLVPGHPWIQGGRRNLEILLREIAGGQGRPEPGSGGA